MSTLKYLFPSANTLKSLLISLFLGCLINNLILCVISLALYISSSVSLSNSLLGFASLICTIIDISSASSSKLTSYQSSYLTNFKS
nr:hypothetical protein [Clostridia bacterium]